MSAAAWDALRAELDAWGAAGRTAAFWWRDDDATRPTPALDRLVDLAGGAGVPPALAVIPAQTNPALAAWMAEIAGPVVLQHGYAHANHAGPDAKKIELGADRSRDEILTELREGRVRLGLLFESRLEVLVPPWNRIDPGLIAALPAAGFAGLSGFGPRAGALAAPGIVQVNCHCDPIDWRGGRGFVGAAAAIGALGAHLAARREGRADADEPTGLLTHHLVMDEECWDFLATLTELLGAHPAARWLAPWDLWPEAAPA